MTEFYNPIEKYNKQDRKIFGFLDKADNILNYITFMVTGVIAGAILGLFIGKISIYWYLAGGLIAGVGFGKGNIWMKKTFDDDIPIIPVLLLICLIIVGCLYVVSWMVI